MDNVECQCADWASNIALVNGPVQLQFIRTGQQYTGKKFTHCPWCGMELRRKWTPVHIDTNLDSIPCVPSDVTGNQNGDGHE